VRLGPPKILDLGSPPVFGCSVIERINANIIAKRYHQ
jgi:hypothetical protein